MKPPMVGEPVLYCVSEEYPGHAASTDGVCAAIVCHVNDDGTVNLAVFDVNGAQSAIQYVPFIDEGVGPDGPHATSITNREARKARKKSKAK